MRNWLCAVVGRDQALSVASRWLSYVLIFTFFTLLGSPSSAITGSTTHQAVSSTASWIELSDGGRINSSDQVSVDDASVSLPGLDVSHWQADHDILPTVLQILEDDLVYKDLYFGMNLTSPGDLWENDWWYRTNFTAPFGHEVSSLIFKGINYCADICAHGKKVADKTQVVGMYNSFEFDASKNVHHGGDNVLAVKITPEKQPIPSKPSRDGFSGSTVELGDTWLDWLNWNYIAVYDPKTGFGFSFPPDRNSGVWKRLYLGTSSSVTIRNPYVATELPFPETNSASLTVYCDISNRSSKPVSESCKEKSAGQANRRFSFSSQCLSSAMRPKRFPFHLMRFPS